MQQQMYPNAEGGGTPTQPALGRGGSPAAPFRGRAGVAIAPPRSRRIYWSWTRKCVTLRFFVFYTNDISQFQQHRHALPLRCLQTFQRDLAIPGTDIRIATLTLRMLAVSIMAGTRTAEGSWIVSRKKGRAGVSISEFVCTLLLMMSVENGEVLPLSKTIA